MVSYSPALSATHLPFAFTATSAVFSFQTQMSTMFYDIMINCTEMHCEPMQNVLVNLVSDPKFHLGKTKIILRFNN